MAGKLVVGTLSTGATEIGLDELTANKVRAWVSFKGNDTVSIVRSFNVSSITDHGTGNYEVHFSKALPHADYAVAVSAKEYDSNNGSSVSGEIGIGTISEVFKTTSVRVVSKAGDKWYDSARMTVMVVC